MSGRGEISEKRAQPALALARYGASTPAPAGRRDYNYTWRRAGGIESGKSRSAHASVSNEFLISKPSKESRDFFCSVT